MHEGRLESTKEAYMEESLEVMAENNSSFLSAL